MEGQRKMARIPVAFVRIVLEQAILDATVEVVAQSGFAAAKLEDIARRAGTGKAAIYRRWASKTALVARTSTSEFIRRAPDVARWPQRR